MRRLRNLLIGALLLLVGGYFAYVALQLIGFHIDRAFLVEDMLHGVYPSSILASQQQIENAEKMFINNSYIAYLVSLMPYGIVIFTAFSLTIVKFGYRICYCNLYPKH